VIRETLESLTPQGRNTFYKTGVITVLALGLCVVVGVALRSRAHPAPLPFTVVVPLAALISGVHAFWRMGWRRLLAFVVIGFAVCFGAEFLSTHIGFPFGEYTYDEKRVGRMFGSVPWTVPLAWFAMLYPSLLMANLLVDGQPKVGGPGLGRLLLISVVGATLMTVWDLALDPHMVHHEGAWTWRYSDECRQQECMKDLASVRCVRSCKDDCTRPESPQYCAVREVFGPGETDLGECAKGRRLEPFLDRCARRCRANAPDGDFEQGCDDLTRGVAEIEAQEGSPDQSRERKALHRGQNWKLSCERECCGADCESACVAAHPVRSDDEAWWLSVGGHPSTIADWSHRTFPWYFQRGFYQCIPFSNFYGWMITSFLALALYGWVKQEWLLDLEKAAADRKGDDGIRSLYLAQQVPDDLTLLDSNDRGESWERTKVYWRKMAEDRELLPFLNLQKLLTGSGVLIYVLVAWCNVVFAHPAGLSLLAVLTMGLPCVAALLRLFRSDGERALAQRMFEEHARRPRKKRFYHFAEQIQSAEQQVIDEPDQGEAPEDPES
jgi:uncharacterized membrane protein